MGFSSTEKGFPIFKKKLIGRLPVFVISKVLLNTSGELLEFHKYLKFKIFRLKERDGLIKSATISVLFKTVL